MAKTGTMADRAHDRILLRRVDADDDELIGVLRFESFEVVHDMDAVDAAVRPEIEPLPLPPAGWLDQP